MPAHQNGTTAMPLPHGPHVSASRPLTPPIYQAATFLFDEQVYADLPQGGLDAHWYSRYRNPTVDAAAAEIANLEGAEAAFMTASGMAAISAVLVSLLHAGGRVVASRQMYGDTYDLLTRDLLRYGVDVTFVDGRSLEDWRAAATASPTAVLYTETLSNPVLALADLPALVSIARSCGARLVVDSTFTTPYAIRPLALGADVVVHSVTKFLNGHGDVTAGAVVADRALIREVQRNVIRFGGCLDPHAAYLVWRGLRTFDVRMERACATARELATALAARDDVHAVFHPSLPDYRDRDVAARTMVRADACALVTLVVRGGDERALAVMGELRVACEATSLGGTETLVSVPFNSSHLSLTPQQLREAGVDEGTIRVSCGLEQAADLIADFTQALDTTKDLM
jgi:cystathionine beta-lyase/cystathionine gamma-synthase